MNHLALIGQVLCSLFQIQMLNIGHISTDINIYGLMGIPGIPSQYVW